MMTSQATTTPANHRTCRGRWLSRALATVAVMSLPVASAQTLWMPNVPGSYSWQTSTNWLPNGVPSGNGSQAVMLNPIAPGVQTVSLDGAITLGGLTFENTQGSNFFLTPGTSGALTFNSGGLGNAAIVQTGGASNVISAPIALAENLKVQVDAGNLNLSGVVSGTGFGLVKEGDGMLILSGANTFTGANTLNDGITLALVNNAFGGTAGGTTVNSGATLAVGGINGNGITVTDNWTVSGSGYLGLGAIRGMYGVNTNALSGNVTFAGSTVIHNDIAGTLQFNGNMVMDQSVRFNTHGFISLNGVVTGSTDIVKYGISGLRFANNTSANTYSGSITSILGEVRAEFVNAYQNVSRFTMRNSNLQLVFANNVNSTEGRLNDATPIDLYGGRIRLENSGFTGNPAFNFAETVGAVTLKGGGSMFDLRGNTTTTSVALTLSSLTREAMGSTVYMEVNGTISGAAQLGTGTQSRILNLGTVNQYNGIVGGWATTRLINGSGEFMRYDATNGYTALTSYSLDSAQTGWTDGTLNVKLTGGGATLTGSRSINSLNIYSDTARTLDLGANTLTVQTGGIMFSRNNNQGPTHVISNGFITAGPGEAGFYELFLHTANANGNISAVIRDNGVNPVSVVKAGPNTVSFLATQTYTGSTYMNEGVLRDYIGYRSFDPTYSAIPSTNINVVGSIVGQSVLEYDRDFTRALGAGSNQIQFTGGTGSGFSAYGSPIKVNFGGSGDAVTWGSTYFNPSIYTLNGGNATHVVTMINPIDLNGEVRYIRLDGGSSGGGRSAIGRFEGDLYNGGIVKRGGGTLLIDNAKTYTMGTSVSEGLLWVRGAGNLGANTIGNDINIGGAGALHIDSPTNVGSNQRIVIQNTDNNNASAIGFGPGYGDGSSIAFQSFNTGSAPLSSGGNNIFVTNSQSGQARRVAVQIYGMETAVDFPGLIRNVAPFAEVWFGATTANAVFNGTTITPTGNTAVDTSRAFRLGSGGGTLTITNANVLTGAFPLIVGAPNQDARTNIGGVIYLPQAQSYSGQVTVGNSGALVVGQNGALSTTNNTINLRSGDLRLSLQTGTYFGTDSQYSARNIDVAGGNSTLRAESLGGSGQSLITLNTLRLDGNDRVLTTYSSTTRQNGFLFLGKTTLTNTSAGNSFIDVGFDNQGFNSGFIYLMGEVEQTGTGDRTLIKRNGGTLVLGAANTFKGGLQVQQGNLVLTHLSAGGVGTTITMAVNNDRTARLNFMKDGSGPFLYNYPLSFTGGNNGSNRIITVAPETVSSTNVNQEVQVPSISWAAVSSVTNFDLITDGAHGYRFTVNGGVTLARDINFRTRGALTTVQGAITGAFNVLKADQGTLWLNGNNTYTGATTVNNGYLVLGHDSAVGGSSAVSFGAPTTATSAQILLSGTRTISKSITNSATGGTQTLGGLDAGNKTFSGGITATRGINVSSITGGDVNFTGVISGTTINKVGYGNVVLNPSTGTGNTYSGGTTVTAGTLIGKAQTTSGNPFGTGAITVANGTIQLDGRTGATSSAISTAGLTVSGGARVVVNDQASDAFSTTLGFSTLTRSGGGTVTFVPQLGNLGTQELITFSTNPTLVNGMVGTWAVRTASGSNAAADYVTTTGSGPYSITTATYGGTGNLDSATGATQVFNAGATPSLLSANRSVFAFRSDAVVDLATYKLSVGGSGQAGIILNNGASITGSAGSQLDFGNNLLSLYVDSAAVSSISVPLTNVRDNSNNTFSTNADPAVNNAPVFVKFGRGVLQLNTAATFQGGITVNEGTLRAGAANVFPTFTNLNAVSGSIVTISPGATVDLNNFDQEFGNLSGGKAGAEFQFAGGVLNLGSAKLTVGRESPGTTSTQNFSGQVVGGAGSRIIKVGTGRLVLDNISGNSPNSLDVLEINQGIVRTWLNDQSWATPTSFASSIPSTTTVLLRGGEWEAYAIGDSTGNQQIIQLGNNVIHQSADSTIEANRATGGGSNKLMTLGTLSLDVQRFLITGANTFIPRFDGVTTLTNHARIQTDTQLVLAGGIDDGGNYYTVTKIGGSDLTIDKDNSATWKGGLVITQGTLYLGTRGADEIRAPGVTLTLNGTANAGTGDIILNQGFTTTTAMRMAAPSNILTAQGQRLQTFGSETSGTVRIDLGTDAPLSSYGLRSTSNGSISLGLGDGGLYTSTLDQAAMGSGRWGLSAFQGATYYMPSTLGVGFDNTYRFMGTNGGVLGLVSTNILTGDNSVVLGRDPLDVGNTPTNSFAQIRTYGNQNFTGNTTIHRGADYGSIGNILIFHGDYATPQFEVYGRLEARGDGRFTNDAGAQGNDVILRPGGALRLDYNMDVNDQFVIARLENSNLGFSAHENKWGDDEPMILDGAQFGIINSSGRVNSETVGQITVKGGAGILLERNGTNGQPIIITNEGIVRDGQAILSLRSNVVAEVGATALQSQKFYINDPAWVAANSNNGMFNPWFFSASNLSYLGYSADTGVFHVPYSSTGTGAPFLAGLTSTSIAHYSTAGNATLTGNVNAYALRVTGTTTLTGQQINLHSGGLITNGNVNIDSNLYFGNGTTPVEGIIYANDSTLTINGKVTATTLTRGGASTVVLANTANDITGNIQVNGGTLIANGPGTLGTAPTITLHADYLNNNNGSQMPILSLRTASVDATFNHEVIVAANVPIARVDLNRFGTVNVDAVKTITIPALTVKGTDGAGGTLLQIESNSPNDNRPYTLNVNGLTKLEGTSDIGLRISQGTTIFNGAVTSVADIYKTGDGVLRFNSASNSLTGDFIMNRGEWFTVGDTAAVAGTGNVISNFGVIRMANTSGTIGTRFSAPNQTVTVNGQTTFVTQRVGSTNANISIGATNNTNGNIFTTNNSPWIIFQSASFGDQININSSVVINDAPWFRTDSAFTLFRTGSVVSGEGKLNKAGTYLLAFDNNAPNTYAGGTDVWAGELQLRQANATLGQGAVRVFAGASLAARGISSLGTTGVTQIVTSNSAFPVIGLRGNDGAATFSDTFNAVINRIATTATIVGNGNGILAVSGGQTLAVDPDLGGRNGGIFANWWLGSQEGSGTVSANSLMPWGPMGDEYRLGGGHNGTVTMNPTLAGSDQLSGTARLVVGGGQNVMGYGAVAIGASADNSFEGGTLVSRTRDLSGAFRGAALVLQGGQVGTSSYRKMLGFGDVDVFGEIRVEGGSSTLRVTATSNLNNLVFHPGSRIRFDNGTIFGYAGSQGRWADNTGMALNTTVLEMYGDDTNNDFNSETIGNLTISGGSEVALRRRGSNWAELKVGDITRSGDGTLMITTMVDSTNTANILGASGTSSALRLIAANGSSLVDSQGMVEPWIFSRVDSQFLKYDSTNGFQLITQGTVPSNYKAITTTTLTPGTVVPANDGSEILSLEGSSTFTLGGDLDIHALRVQRDININAAAGYDSITIRSGGLMQVSSNSPTINANLYFGVNGTKEAFLSASNNTLQLNGKIYATKVVKSGTGFVNIRSEQSQFTGDWVVNGGGIQFLTPGAASTGQVFLNGSRMNDRDNTYNLTEVRYNFNPGTPDVFTWTGGKITATDYNRIYGISTTDRTIQIPAIDLKTTNAVAGTGQEGAVVLRMDGLRSVMRTGTVTLYDHYLLNIETDRGGPGATTGVQLGSGTGVNGIYNQGLFDVRKIGIGMLILGDNSSSFINGRTFTIGEGGVRVTHNGAFGNSSISAIINPTAALEIAVPNWTPTANLTQAWGSTERWAVNQARGSGDYTLPTGVHLQIMASQTGTRTINLDGGSIMGYLPLDWEQVAVNHTLTSGITVNLLSDSYLGQLYPAGTSNGSNHFMYDMGKMNTTTNLNPNDPGLRGSYLHIDGNITGNFDLTKVGQDMIILSGPANSFRNTNIENGVLQIGRNNALPVTTELTTRFSGMFDLNGYNQEVAALKGTGGSIHNGGFDYNTLTVNQATNTVYGGQINGSTNLVKSNAGELTLSSANSAYVGDTKINEGRLVLTGEGAINESRWIQVGAGAGFDVSARTGASYSFDGVVSGGGVGALRVNNGNRGSIIGSLVVRDAIGLVSRKGTLAPGLSSTGGLTSAGDQIGHLYISQNLTLAAGTATAPVERLTLQLGGATTTLEDLGWVGEDMSTFILGLDSGTANQQGVLNGTFGDLSSHDYVNVGGEMTLNQYGTVRVSYSSNYTPQAGDVFNLLDWTTISNVGFSAGSAQRLGGGYEGSDLYLPTLSPGYSWNTSLFANYGVLVVVPEPSRALLLMGALLALGFRRRRAE